ncbi:MAG: T9SS type A sorting domain-containing protein [Bacteroidia bacterium]
MKTNFTILYFILIIFTHANAQVVDENVHFDFYQNASNNDFINHFSGGLGLTQIQTSGITGGCLTAPDSISWGNDNAIYCSKYKPNIGDTIVTTACFKYDGTTIHPASFQRAMSIWLTPQADFNHYIIATVSGDSKIELLTYSWNNNPYPLLTLIQNHWYRYKLSVVMIGGATHQVYVKAEVFDLGLSGTATPSLVNSSNGTFQDNILVADTAIQVSITGATYGGCAYLDDFHFHGQEGFTNCINVGAAIADPVSSETISVYMSDKNILHIINNDKRISKMDITIFNLEGSKLKEYETSDMNFNLDLSELSNGVYFARVRTIYKTTNTKIIVNR